MTMRLPVFHAGSMTPGFSASGVAVLTTVVLAATLWAGQVGAAQQPAAVGKVVIGAPNPGALECTDTDFGAVQIRIGLHATLAACYREVELKDRLGTAFVTIPREFEDRLISAEEFNAFRAEVSRTEEQFKRRARETQPGTDDSLPQDSRPIPLGVFDNTDSRVGYAYAYAVTERDVNGELVPQTMMRTESFVLVNGHVILLMIIAPVDDGTGASVTFNLSERWAKEIVSASTPPAQAAAGKVTRTDGKTQRN